MSLAGLADVAPNSPTGLRLQKLANEPEGENCDWIQFMNVMMTYHLVASLLAHLHPSSTGRCQRRQTGPASALRLRNLNAGNMMWLSVLSLGGCGGNAFSDCCFYISFTSI